MFQFTSSQITIAGEDDIPALVRLLNHAYRGKESQKGWTTEAHLIDGNVRTDADSVMDVMHKDASVFLKYSGDNNELLGCVNLQKHNQRIYLGMFAVSPLAQGSGIGKKILEASEEYARQVNSTSIYMTVITLRDELINWYKRHGYADTGERKPFYEDGKSGHHLQELEFMILEKQLQNS